LLVVVAFLASHLALTEPSRLTNQCVLVVGRGPRATDYTCLRPVLRPFTHCPLHQIRPLPWTRDQRPIRVSGLSSFAQVNVVLPEKLQSRLSETKYVIQERSHSAAFGGQVLYHTNCPLILLINDTTEFHINRMASPFIKASILQFHIAICQSFSV
jgi:hypothetical protein